MDHGHGRGVARVRQEGISGTLGREIVAGQVKPGDVVTLDELQGRFGCSRTVVRDGVKVLESLGLLYSKRRVGLVVKPSAEWNLYAPSVIGWRLESDRAHQTYVELTQLRIAVEPEAAALAAQYRTEAQAQEVLELAARMRRLGEAGLLEDFMTADVTFHRLLLRASSNTMFEALGDVVAEVLTGRTQHGLMPTRPRADALAAHEGVAQGVSSRSPGAARENMQFLVDEVRAALEE